VNASHGALRNKMEAPDDLPWTEEEWELYLRRLDVQSARLWDLFQTFLDHPDRDSVINEEMGWTPLPSAGDAPQRGAGGAGADSYAERGPARTASGDATPKEPAAPLPAHAVRPELQSKLLRTVLTTLGKAENEPDIEEVVYWLDRMAGHAGKITSELQEADRLGEAPHVLNGNIVHCRRALREYEGLRRTLDYCAEEAACLRDPFDALLPEVLRLEESLARHIANLRTQVVS
jgi:hypothetical protein